MKELLVVPSMVSNTYLIVLALELTIIKDFLDSIDGSYCTYSAFGETGNCVAEECADPVYPDPNPAGYQGQLEW
jgi:hypothetical protein